MRSTLLAWEDGTIYGCCKLRICCQNDRASWAAEGLVRREVNDVGDANGVRVLSSNDEPCGVCDIGKENGSDRIGDIPKRLPVWLPRIGRESSNDHLGTMLQC